MTLFIPYFFSIKQHQNEMRAMRDVNNPRSQNICFIDFYFSQKNLFFVLIEGMIWVIKNGNKGVEIFPILAIALYKVIYHDKLSIVAYKRHPSQISKQSSFRLKKNFEAFILNYNTPKSRDIENVRINPL